MSEGRRRRRRKGKKSKTPIIIAVILVIIIGTLGYGYYTFFGRLQRSEMPKTDDELGIQPDAPHETNVINIAFFGLDRRDTSESSSRSDSIIVVSVDKENQRVKMTSLMRDMYVPIPGKSDNRINAAYAFGGPSLAVKTINTNFGLDIRDYVTVDFFGLEKLIDKVGGVEIDVSTAEAKYVNGYLAELNSLNKDTVSQIKPGKQVLNGRQAVAYSRIRYVGRGDYERTERQREVLDQLFKKVKAQGTSKLPGLVSAMIPYIETSLSDGEIISLAMDAVKFDTSSIDQFRLPVDGNFTSQNIRGMAVLVPDIAANKEKLHEFIYGEK